jgi:tight adherence protein B
VRLLAALSAGVFAYLAAGYITGVAPSLSWRTSGSRAVVSSGQLWLLQAGLQMSPARFWAASLVVGLGGLFAGVAMSGTVWVALPPAISMAALPRWFYARRRLRRLAETQQAWPDGLRHLVGSVRSGMSLAAALDELSLTGPDGLREAFARYPTLARVLGPTAALEAVRDELADPTTDRIVEVLLLAYQRGGSIVPEILYDLAEATTRDLRTLEEIRSNALEQRINARIVFAVPWFVLLLLTARPGQYRDFYRSSLGLVVVVVAGVLSLAGAVWVARLGREPVEERVFGSEPAEIGV